MASFAPANRAVAEALVRELVDVGARFRALHAQQLARNDAVGGEMAAARAEQRRALYVAARSGSPTPTVIAALRGLSLAKLEDVVVGALALRQSTASRQSALESLQAKVTALLARCAALMPVAEPLSWRLRYVCEVDPLERGAALQLGGAIVDAAGRNLWSDYCGVCYAEIATGARRLRCFECDEGVVCEECDAATAARVQIAALGDVASRAAATEHPH